MPELSLVLCLACLLTGCAVTQDQNTPVSERHEVDRTTGRGYWIYVPSGYRADTPSEPLIVTCHGTPPYDVSSMHIREWKKPCRAERLHRGRAGADRHRRHLRRRADHRHGRRRAVHPLAGERTGLPLQHRPRKHANHGFFRWQLPTYWVGLRHPDVFTTVVARNCNFSQSNTEGWWTPESLARRSKFTTAETIRASSRASRSRPLVTCARPGGNRGDPRPGHERHPEVAMDFFRRHWKAPAAVDRGASGRRSASGEPITRARH